MSTSGYKSLASVTNEVDDQGTWIEVQESDYDRFFVHTSQDGDTITALEAIYLPSYDGDRDMDLPFTGMYRVFSRQELEAYDLLDEDLTDDERDDILSDIVYVAAYIFSHHGEKMGDGHVWDDGYVTLNELLTACEIPIAIAESMDSSFEDNRLSRWKIQTTRMIAHTKIVLVPDSDGYPYASELAAITDAQDLAQRQSVNGPLVEYWHVTAIDTEKRGDDTFTHYTAYHVLNMIDGKVDHEISNAAIPEIWASID